MTRTTDTTKTTPATKTNTPMSTDEVKKMLRDAAFVLHMTRRVKAEMLAERPEIAEKSSRKTSEVAAGLVV